MKFLHSTNSTRVSLKRILFNKWCTFEKQTGYACFSFFFWIASTLSIISIKKNERLQKIAWQCAKWTMTPKMNTVWNKIMAIGNLIINEVSYDKHINPFYWNWISNTSANRQKNWFWIQFPHNVLTFNDKSHLIFLS